MNDIASPSNRTIPGLEPIADNSLETGKRERTKAANRDAILEAARHVFAALGFQAATVRDIIRRTGLASGTFYNYFKSKEELCEAIVDDQARQFRPILKSVAQEATSFEDYIERGFFAYFSFIASNYVHPGVPLRERGPYLQANTPEMNAIRNEILDALLREIEAGRAPNVNARFLANACIGVGEKVGEVMLQSDPPDVMGASRFAVDLILGGLVGMRADKKATDK